MKFIKPKKLPEANIQAEVYRQLRNNGIKCCLEYRINIPETNRSLIADVVIIKENNVALIIECKSRRYNSTPNPNGRQYKNYEKLGVPFIYCMTFKQALCIMDEIYNHI